MTPLERTDPEIFGILKQEEERQEHRLELIASENFASPAVMEAQGSILTNKYAEGYPGRRYYGGCANVDVVENLARQRAMDLFHAEHANVQPHSGTQANMAVYFSVMKPGDTYLRDGSPARWSSVHGTSKELLRGHLPGCSLLRAR